MLRVIRAKGWDLVCAVEERKASSALGAYGKARNLRFPSTIGIAVGIRTLPRASCALVWIGFRSMVLCDSLLLYHARRERSANALRMQVHTTQYAAYF
jgi:hypothetical protein